MMILGFKPQFKQKILDGTKIHTIREDRNNRWQTGKKIHFATGVRTKNYHQFKEGECKSIQAIWINPKQEGIQINDRALTRIEVHWLAKYDGFDSIEDLYSFFLKESKEPFDAKIIHWTDFVYL